MRKARTNASKRCAASFSIRSAIGTPSAWRSLISLRDALRRRSEWAERALHDRPRIATAIRVKIVANAHLGRLDEARAELARMLAIDPGLTITGYRMFLEPSIAPELIELLVTGLRLAGLPEG
jgi:hypothetical protein